MAKIQPDELTRLLSGSFAQQMTEKERKALEAERRSETDQGAGPKG